MCYSNMSNEFIVLQSFTQVLELVIFGFVLSGSTYRFICTPRKQFYVRHCHIYFFTLC